jgi:hypothetical protein
MEGLGKHFRTLTRAAFTRYGFAYADLLSQWPAIVGEDLAQASEPERIKWPRNGEEKKGGTLILRAAPGRALDLQHEVMRITERINAFYGYGAIAAIKIVQGTFRAGSPGRVQPTLEGADAEALEARLSTIEDPALKQALTRLGTGALTAGDAGPGK